MQIARGDGCPVIEGDRVAASEDPDRLAELIRTSEKFILPDGGSALPDPRLAAIRRDLPIRLPFPGIALEWSQDEFRDEPVREDPQGRPDLVLMCPTKRILLAREDGDKIRYLPLFWFPPYGKWTAMSGVSFAMEGALAEWDGKSSKITYRRESGVDGNETSSLWPLFSLLNYLNCSNVRAETATTARDKGARKTKSALPFDVYRVLTVGNAGGGGIDRGGTHRSPREHLRRGTIVRQANGNCHWRNSTIVCPGAGGKVEKSYRIKSSCSA